MAETEAGLYSVNVDKMVNMLSKAYINLINAGVAFKKFPSVMLWGPPGVGKSQGIREIAKCIEQSTDRRVEPPWGSFAYVTV